ncbi:MAG: YraN family protein [Deltaproteobacteria bacterium]|nr:YraN family protein [Deltaproteobacteria bacterium]
MNGFKKGLLGRYSEELVVKYLLERGYKIVLRNYRCPVGEIDIISQKGEYICFVEVRSRSESDYGRPYETVTFSKQKKISKTAKYFIAQYPQFYNNYSFRFDVASVILKDIDNYSIEYIEGAFEVLGI